MNSRERALCAVNRTKGDRVPADFSAVGEIVEALWKRLNIERGDYYSLFETLNIDCVQFYPEYKGNIYRGFEDGSYEGLGGSIYKNVTNNFGTYSEVIKYALDGAENFRDVDRLLKMPNIDDFNYDAIPFLCKRFSDKYISVGNASTLYQTSLWCNTEDLLVNMALNEELSTYIFNKATDWSMDICERMLIAGNGRIDTLQIADDYATQQDPLISIDMFRKYFSPALKRFSSLAKAYNANVYLHCCGSAYKLIPEFIECGVQILDPIQTTASNMDPSTLKRNYGDKLCFHGGVETQKVLPSGTAQDVRENVRALIDTLGKDGGYILTSCHSIQADVPIENIFELYDMKNRNY